MDALSLTELIQTVGGGTNVALLLALLYFGMKHIPGWKKSYDESVYQTKKQNEIIENMNHISEKLITVLEKLNGKQG